MQACFFLCAATGVAIMCGCQPRHESVAIASHANAIPAASSPATMAMFWRLIDGHWKMTTTAGRDTFDTWYRGAGEHSIRSMRLGTLTEGEPWSAVTVYYWHPTLKDVRLLSVGSVWRGVAEGKSTFDGDVALNEYALFQVGGPRTLRERWIFAGPDAYRDELSEKVGGDFKLMVAWDRVRVDVAPTAAAVKAPLLAQHNAPSEFLRPLEKLLGDAWASMDAASGSKSQPSGAVRTRATFAYVPLADMIEGRIEMTGAGGAPSHAMDIFLYHHTGKRSLRVLALGSDGPDGAIVYEGDITPAADNMSLAMKLIEHRSTGQHAFEARADFEEGGTMRVQIWKLQGQERTLVMDRRHSRVRE